MAAPTPSSRITEEEWDRHKQAITSLYLGTGHSARDGGSPAKGQTLDELAASMTTSHGFTASKSQFEEKLKSWGARKSLKPHEWKSVFERLDRLPPTTKSRVVISGRVVRQNQITRARRYQSSKPRAVGRITTLNLSKASPLAQQVRIEVQGQDGGWTQLPESISDNTGSEQPLPSTSYDTTRGGIRSLEGRQDFAELARFEEAIPPIESSNEAIETAIHSNFETVLFDNNHRMTDMSSYEQPSTISPAVEFNDPMALVNFSLPSPGEDGTYGNVLPALSINPVATGVPAQGELIALFGNERRQLLSPRPAATPSGDSHAPTIPFSSWVNVHSSHLPVWRGSQWMRPSAKVSFIFIQDIYSNACNPSASNAMSTPFSLANCFLAEMTQPPSVATTSEDQSTRRHTAISVLNYLLSTETFFGESFAEPPNGLAAQLTVEARLYSRLITSAVNGLSCLKNIPASGVLRFLSRHPAMQVSIIRLLSSAHPTNKSLAENIFRAALEDDNVEVVKFLLHDTKLVHANNTVCYYKGERYTPLSKAILERSYGVVKFLVDLKTDINKSSKDSSYFGPFDLLIRNVDLESPVEDNFLDLLNTFILAGATLRSTMLNSFRRLDSRVALFLIEKLALQSPLELISTHCLIRIIREAERTEATKVIILIIEQCQRRVAQWPCNRYSQDVDNALCEAATRGYVELTDALGDVETKIFASLISALRSGDHNRFSILQEGSLLGRLNPLQLGKAFMVALEERNQNFATQILDFDPDLHFINRYDTLGHEFCVNDALDVALANDFDDIAWIFLAYSTNPGCLQRRSLNKVVYTVMKHRKRDFVRAIMNFDRPHHFGYEGPIWKSAMEWGDDIVMNDLFQVKRYANLVSRDDLKFAVDKGRMDWFWAILKSTSNDHEVWSKAAEVAIDKEDVPLLDELIVHGLELQKRWILINHAIKERPSMVKPLLERYQKAGAQPCPDYDVGSAIQTAIELYPGSSTTLDLLFAFGQITGDNINTIIQEESLLLEAIGRDRYPNGQEHPRTTIIKRLIDIGADVNAFTNSKYRTTNPLLSAIETENTGVVQLLIQRAADVNRPAGYGIKYTALQKAAELNIVEIVQLLLDDKADTNAPPPKLGGATALQFAAINGNCHMAMMLIEHGARLDVPPPVGPYGRWPLEGAAENGRLDMIQLLWDLNNGPFDDKQCRRAMSLAEYNGHIGCKDLISELMRNGSTEHQEFIA
ncbi:hypothetical protein F4678DRAFT_285152 [Xylaria arbuscula]|nr:hypothetical protein F4678DRAFT_285152 [Xylaria arbuscula]